MTILSHGNYKFETSHSVSKILWKHRQLGKWDKEAGGILLGQFYENRILIDRATLPNKRDRRGRNTFVRNAAMAQLFIDYEFANSGGRRTYLGEWHTHPENHPISSSQDLRMIRDQYHSNILSLDFSILIIQGLKTAYAGFFDGHKIYQMKQNNHVNDKSDL